MAFTGGCLAREVAAYQHRCQVAAVLSQDAAAVQLPGRQERETIDSLETNASSAPAGGLVVLVQARNMQVGALALATGWPGWAGLGWLAAV
jgi:hypothetical protein